MAKLYELKYHEDEFPQKREMTREDIIFLTSLQKEMNTQDHVSQADPRFWVIRGTERKYHIDASSWRLPSVTSPHSKRLRFSTTRLR